LTHTRPHRGRRTFVIFVTGREAAFVVVIECRRCDVAMRRLKYPTSPYSSDGVQDLEGLTSQADG
jgi:hypothetical protein